MARSQPSSGPMQPPDWFVWLIKVLSPQSGGIGERDYQLEYLWEIRPSIFWVFPRLLPQIGRAIRYRMKKTFCLKMALTQLCVPIWFFYSVLSPQLLPLLAVIFVFLLVREAYVPPTEKTLGRIRDGIDDSAACGAVRYGTGSVFSELAGTY